MGFVVISQRIPTATVDPTIKTITFSGLDDEFI